MTEIERIKEYSRSWNLEGLKGIASRYGDDAPPGIRETLADAIGHHYAELWMGHSDEKLTGDPIENVTEIIDLLEILKRLGPSCESEIQHSSWLRELADLHPNRDAKGRYLGAALGVIDVANDRYPGNANVLSERIRVLTDVLLPPGPNDDGLEDLLLNSAREAMTLLTGATAGEISATVHQTLQRLEPSRPELAARIRSEFRAAVQAATPDQPDVVLIAAREFASMWARWNGPDPDRRDLEELEWWFLSADELPRYGPDAMDKLADEIFHLAGHIDLRREGPRRERYTRIALGMYERIIRDHAGFLQAYDDKARLYHRRAEDLLELGDTTAAAALLREGISWLEQVDPTVILPRSLYASRLRLHRLFIEHIDRYQDREHNLRVVGLIRLNIEARLEFYREVFSDRKQAYYAAHDNRDFEDLARLQLKCGLTEEAWSTLTEWNAILREQRALWGYLPRDIGELLRDREFAPLHQRLEQTLQENAERDRNEEETSHEDG